MSATNAVELKGVTNIVLRYFLAFFCLVLFFTTQGFAKNAPSDSRPVPDIDLIFETPENFEIKNKNETQGLRILEIAPKDQNLSNWTDMITYTAAEMEMPLPLTTFFDAMMTGYSQACKGAVSSTPLVSMKSRFEVILVDMMCPLNEKTNEGEYARIFMVNSRYGVYTIQRAWKGKPFAKDQSPLSEQQKKEWEEFFRNIKFCNSEKGQKQDCAAVGDLGTQSLPVRSKEICSEAFDKSYRDQGADPNSFPKQKSEYIHSCMYGK